MASFEEEAPTSTTPCRIGLVWFKYSDLRLADHGPLYHAHCDNESVAHMFCIDERWLQSQTRFGMQKTGKFRIKFLLESLIDLKNNLQALGSDLIVTVGKPEEKVSSLAKELGATTIYSHSEICSEEVAVDVSTKKRLGRRTRFWQCWGNTLFNLEDLPFNMDCMPTTYTAFRKAVERTMPMKDPYPIPPCFKELPHGARELANTSSIPTLEELRFEAIVPDPRAVLDFKGGESEGMARLNGYFFERDCLREYKVTRNGMLGADYSSKFSPWLAHGCLSPRVVYQQIKLYEQERITNDSTYWLFFELMWRDFFHFLAVRYGNDIFKLGGPQRNPSKQQWSNNPLHFQAWCDGQTGYPFIDANMRELKESGFMSNRGRQVVASFLVKDMGIDWRAGAEYFEEYLIDYDPCSNWGNWTYVAGVGSDPREDRYFNIVKQATVYDKEANYIKHWCPELADLPPNVLFQPHVLLNDRVRDQYCIDEQAYPRTIVPLRHSSFSNPKAGGQNRNNRRKHQNQQRRQSQPNKKNYRDFGNGKQKRRNQRRIQTQYYADGDGY